MNSGFQLLKGKADGEPKWFFSKEKRPHPRQMREK